jgi:hypothetical protein
MRAILPSVIALVAAGCGPSPRHCVDAGGLPSCEAVPAPAFATLHAAVIGPSCAVSGPSCHSDEAAAGDLALGTPDSARAILLELYVAPGEPACSELVRRVTSTERFVQMPPARPLSVEEQCAILAWVREGAPP